MGHASAERTEASTGSGWNDSMSSGPDPCEFELSMVPSQI